MIMYRLNILAGCLNGWKLMARSSVAMTLVLTVLLALPALGRAGTHNGMQVLQIPVSWCALQGSPATQMPPPAVTGEMFLNGVLWRRHERATDNVWHDQAAITFRSGVMGPFVVAPGGPPPQVDFPVIADPDTTVGSPGDVVAPFTCSGNGNTCNSTASAGQPGSCPAGQTCQMNNEVIQAWQDCQTWWTNQSTTHGRTATNTVGILALNINRWLDGNGNPVVMGGYAGTSGAFTGINFPAAALVDNVYLRDQPFDGSATYSFTDFNEIITAHEFGHTLNLQHVTPMNRLMCSGLCDTQNPSVPFGDLTNTTLTATEVSTARAQAQTIPALMMDPPLALVPGPVLRTTQMDVIGDTSPDTPSVDLQRHAVTQDRTGPREEMIFSHLLAGLIESPDGLRYWTLVDRDNDIGTGATNTELAGQLGVPTGSCQHVGIDLAVRTTLVQTEFGIQANATAFEFANETGVFDAGTLIGSDRSSFRVSDGLVIAPEDGAPIFDIVSSILDVANFGLASPLRLSAVAENTDSGVVDFLPDDCALTDAVLEAPVYPVCEVGDGTADPGELVSVEATGLLPDGMSKVIFSDQTVAFGSTDDTGRTLVDFRVPIDARSGLTLITVGVDNTAVTADCTLLVGDRPRIILTPEASVNEVGRDHTVTASVRNAAGDPAAGVEVSFDIEGGPNAHASGVCTSNADCTTDAGGMVSFTYTGDGGGGVDEISAQFVETDGSVLDSNTALKFWDVDCNQNEVADTCDIYCAGFGGLCETGYLGFCGRSEDENGDNVPDECNRPPDCNNAGAEPDELWPPSHGFKEIAIAGVTDPNGDPVTSVITSIFQDEAVDARGSGNTSPDGTGVGTATAQVRSERTGGGDGRVYHIGFNADDGQGGQCSGEVTVCVPQDQRPDHFCVDQGPLYDSTQRVARPGKGSRRR
jgi:hypothetical protein